MRRVKNVKIALWFNNLINAYWINTKIKQYRFQNQLETNQIFQN
jgi:hypothetical protein